MFDAYGKRNLGNMEFFEDAGWTEEEFDRALLAEAKRTILDDDQA